MGVKDRSDMILAEQVKALSDQVKTLTKAVESQQSTIEAILKEQRAETAAAIRFRTQTITAHEEITEAISEIGTPGIDEKTTAISLISARYPDKVKNKEDRAEIIGRIMSLQGKTVGEILHIVQKHF
jgi:hypothetical protein